MAWVTHLRRRLRALLRKSELERDMDDEMRFHLRMEIAERMAAGLDAAEARRQALVAFGGVERFKELARDTRGVRPLENVARDLRQGIRTLGRSPGFSVAAALTLSIGIAAVTTVFALVNRILIQPLPYTDADQLVVVSHTAPGIGVEEAGLSTGTYFHYRRHARTLSSLAVFDERVLNLAGDDAPAERVRISAAGPELFEVLQVQPARGRMFVLEDGAPGFMDLNWTIPVLISHELWQGRFGGDPTIVGRVIRINENSREVIGVMPPGFAFPRPDTRIWMLHMRDSLRAWLAPMDLSAVGRLAPGTTPRDAATELAALLPSIEGRYRDATAERLAELRLSPVVVPLKDHVVGDRRTALLILLGSMGFLLLIAGANVANLFLLRSEHRSRELAIRTAVGAGRGDLIRLLAAESMVLCTLAAAVGYAAAAASLGALPGILPMELPRAAEVRLDAWSLGFTIGVALLAAALFTTLAMLRSPTSDSVATALKSGAMGAGSGRGRHRLRAILVATQVALALALLTGSALMLQSFVRLQQVEAGFEPAGLLTVEIALPYRRAAEHHRIYGDILERVRALPGVEQAAAATSLPLSGEAGDGYPVVVPDGPDTESSLPVQLKFFTPGYFGLIGTHILQGSGIEAESPRMAERPVVVSAALARRLFRDESPIGRPLRRLERDGRAQSTEHDYTIVGVTEDVREHSLREPAAEIVYVPILAPRVEQWFLPTSMTLVIRTALPPLALAPSVRGVIGEYDRSMSVARVRSMEQIVSDSTAHLGFVALLLLLAGVAALFIGAVGIYGVVAYAVRRRTAEIGIRIALGARPGHVAGMVLSDVLLTVMVGLVFGAAGTLALSRVLGTLLYEVSATDPVTLAGIAVLLVSTAMLACALPARSAARVAPTTALRAE